MKNLKKYFSGRIFKILIIGFAIFGLGTGAGYLAANHTKNVQIADLFKQIGPRRENNAAYKFINPLLSYRLPESTDFNSYKPLDEKVSAAISQAVGNKQADSVSVYFRDLNHGRWVGINENEKYEPASLFKVVLMIAYYKEAMADPGVLSRTLLYSKNEDDSLQDVPFQASSTLAVGKSYAIEQLIENMVIYSDNGAKTLLTDNINPVSLYRVFSDLNIPSPNDTAESYVISAKSYSLFFTVLFNSTYLNPEMSEKALNLLSRAQYKDGLVAGVPDNIKVSQKFGEFIIGSGGVQTGLKLHDCGIIYASNSPYILCVMTKGANYNNLASVIKNISSIVYKEISANYKENNN